MAFGSGDANIVAGASAGGIYRHDRATGETIQVAVLPSQSLSPPAISADGNVIAYTQVLGDYCDPLTSICSWDHVFVRDVAAGVTEMVSVSTTGERAKGGHAQRPSISGDGRFVVFESAAWNLAPGESQSINPTTDAFVRDRLTGTTTRASRTPTGGAPNGYSGLPAISDDGSTIAYTSYANDVVPGDTNHRADVFTFTPSTGATARASLTAAGAQANGDSVDPDLSSDGRLVAFETSATNVIPLDQNSRGDVVVRDLVTGAISFGTRFDGEGQPDQGGRRPSISADGRLTVYDSTANDIVRSEGNFWEDVFVLIAYPWKTARAAGIVVNPPGFGFADTGTIRRSAPYTVTGGWQEIAQAGVAVRAPRTRVAISMEDVRSVGMVAEATVAPPGVPAVWTVEGARAVAEASCAGATGGSAVSSIVVDGVTVFEGPGPVPPNTTVPLPNGGVAIVNEQVPQAGGLLVNAARLTAGAVSVTFASALASIDGCR